MNIQNSSNTWTKSPPLNLKHEKTIKFHLWPRKYGPPYKHRHHRQHPASPNQSLQIKPPANTFNTKVKYTPLPSQKFLHYSKSHLRSRQYEPPDMHSQQRQQGLLRAFKETKPPANSI